MQAAQRGWGPSDSTYMSPEEHRLLGSYLRGGGLLLVQHPYGWDRVILPWGSQPLVNIVVHALARPGGLTPHRLPPAWEVKRPAAEIARGSLAPDLEDVFDVLDASLAVVARAVTGGEARQLSCVARRADSQIQQDVLNDFPCFLSVTAAHLDILPVRILRSLLLGHLDVDAPSVRHNGHHHALAGLRAHQIARQPGNIRPVRGHRTGGFADQDDGIAPDLQHVDCRRGHGSLVCRIRDIFGIEDGPG